MKEEKNRKREKAAWITAVLLFLLAAGLTAAGMLFSDPGFDGSEPEALPENAAWTAAGCVLTGESFELSQGQLCSVLTAQLEETPVSWLESSGLRVRTGAEQRLTLYAPVVWNGMRFHVTAEFAVSCDTQSKRLKGELTALQVGRIPVSPAWVTDWLADNLPSGVSMEGATLSVPSELPLVLLGGEQTLAALEITQADLSTEGIEFTFTVNADGTSQLLQDGLGWLEGIFGGN